MGLIVVLAASFCFWEGVVPVTDGGRSSSRSYLTELFPLLSSNQPPSEAVDFFLSLIGKYSPTWSMEGWTTHQKGLGYVVLGNQMEQEGKVSWGCVGMELGGSSVPLAQRRVSCAHV